MPPRYVIHVGPLKTGSTYLQRCLTSTQAALQERGIYYPPELIDRNTRCMHLPVYRSIVQNKSETLRPVFRKINEAGHKIVVLSCEHMSFLRPDELAELRDAIDVPEIDIVYFVRRWSDRIPSLWSQSLFMGGSLTLPEFFLGVLESRTPEYYPKRLGSDAGGYDVDYSLTWRDITSVVGRDALRLFSYSAVADEKADVFVRFCSDILGLEDVPVPRAFGKRRWVSMPREETELLRALNAMYVKEHGDITLEIRNLIKSERFPIDEKRIRAAMEEEKAELVIDDHAAYFDTAYGAMTAYADRVVPGPGIVEGEVFPRLSRKQGYVHPGWMLRPGTANAVRVLYRKMIAAAEDKE